MSSKNTPPSFTDFAMFDIKVSNLLLSQKDKHLEATIKSAFYCNGVNSSNNCGFIWNLLEEIPCANNLSGISILLLGNESGCSTPV